MDEPTNPNALPEDLTALTPEDLDAAVEAARTEASEIQGIDPSQMTDAQADRLVALADFVEAVAVEEDRREQVAAERATRVAEATARLEGGEGDEPGEGDPEDTPAEDPPADTPADGDPVEVTDETTDEPQPVAAGGAVRRMRQRKIPVPVKAKAGGMTLVASADVGSRFAAGSHLSGLDDVVEAFISRSKSFPKGRARQANVRQQHSVVTMERDFAANDGLWDDNPDYGQDPFKVLTAAADETRLPGNSLVAAGGWCAPSETVYGMVSDETTDGIISLPEMGISRGGINFTTGPDFADIYTSAGFSQTEAEAIAGTTKACVEVDCPDFDEVRLDAVGICVKAPLLTNSAYPELVKRWLAGTLIANQHKIAARLITSMRTALGTALVPTLTGTPLAWGLLSSLELSIEAERQIRRLSDSQALEVIAPRWLRAAVRADLANRMGIGADSVTNAQITQHFTDRGAAVQWVLNYQELASPATVITYPATVEVMVYSAGTFVKGTAPVVSLDTVYDTADLQTNVYTAAFVEDGVLLMKAKPGGRRLTIPVNINGMLGSAQLDDNLFTAQAESVGA